MINTQTLLILGAGSSMEFGYPSGGELVQSILNITKPRDVVELENYRYRVKNYTYTSEDKFPVSEYETYRELINEFGENTIQTFHNDLKYSARTSIDSFLEHRKEYRELGKILISLSLSFCEDKETLFSIKSDNWYQLLFNSMNIEWDEFEDNKISIITFNYDRSLETYLIYALHHSYNKSLEECVEKIKKLNIIHFHGIVDDIDYHFPIRNYGDKYKSLNETKESASKIKIIYDDDINEDIIEKARMEIQKANRIFILGFGYHKLNTKRLLLYELISNKSSVYSTSVGLYLEEQDRIENSVPNRHIGLNIFLRNNSSQIGITELLRRKSL